MHTRNFDPRIKLHKRPHYYYNKIYSIAPNCWFHDLLDNGSDPRTPRYWHVFVGVNNRYLDAFPLNGKSNNDVQQSLTWFINKYHPEKLTSDNEPAFTSKATCKLCSDNNVKLYVVTDQQHSSLSVIDRVIRTLRDMNTPKRYHEQSHEPQFNTFSIPKMNRLMNEYNNKYHSTLKCTPNEMFNDIQKEIDFIIKNQAYRNKQHGIKDYNIPVGTFVRYRMNKIPLTKHRYNYSPESYKVIGKDGSLYIIQAKDGSSLIMPRFKLIVTDVNVFPQKSKLTNNIGTVKKILSYDKRSDKYTVLFEGSNQHYTISPSSLRAHTPQKMSQIEKEFFNQNR